MSGSNPEVAPPIVSRPLVRRVIPTYQGRVGFVLGILEAVTGVIIILIAIVVFAIQAFTSVGGSGLLTGIVAIVSGGFGILSAKKRELWMITAHHLLSIITVILSMVLVGAATTGFHREHFRESEYTVSSRKAVDVTALVVAIILDVFIVWSIVLASMALYYGCCKPVSGVTYVSDQTVQYKSSTSTPDGAITQTPQLAEQPAVIQVDQ